MSEAPPSPDLDGLPAPAGLEARAVVEGQVAMLGRLAQAGLNLALAIERQALAAEAASPAADLQGAALAYGRVSRAVRLTIALQGRLLKDLQEIAEVAERGRRGEDARAAQDLETAANARKARVGRIVERLIQETITDDAEADRLADEVYERLEHDDIYGDLSERPVSEIIALICQDLGLAPDWSRLAQEAWAQEEISSGAAGSPLARPPPPDTLRWLDPGQETPLSGALSADLRAASP